MKESKLELKFVHACTDRGWVTLKLNVKGRRGWPDRLVIAYSPRIRLVELKTSKGKLSPMQESVHEMLRLRGIRVYVIRGVREFGEFFRG